MIFKGPFQLKPFYDSMNGKGGTDRPPDFVVAQTSTSIAEQNKENQFV